MTVEKPDEISQELWEEWIGHRRNLAKPFPITRRSIQDSRIEAEKAGISLAEALIFAMRKGWRNFTAAYYLRLAKEEREALSQQAVGRYKTAAQTAKEEQRKFHDAVFGDEYRQMMDEYEARLEASQNAQQNAPQIQQQLLEHTK